MHKPKTIVSAKSLASKAVNKAIEAGESTIKNAKEIASISAHQLGMDAFVSTTTPMTKNIADNFVKVNQKIQDTAQDKVKCLLKTCDCCNHKVEELNKLNQQNLKQNIEDATQLGYAMLKCRNMQDFISLQQRMFELGLNNGLNNYLNSMKFISNMFNHSLHVAEQKH